MKTEMHQTRRIRDYKIKDIVYQGRGSWRYPSGSSTCCYLASKDGRDFLVKKHDSMFNFNREARILSRLAGGNTPNSLPKIQDKFHCSEGRFIVTNYVGTSDLRFPLFFHCNNPKMSMNIFLGIMTDVAGALDHCHSKGIVHMDLKETNIRYDSDSGNGFLIDFDGAAHNGFPICTNNFSSYRFFLFPPEKRGIFVIPKPSIDLYSLTKILEFGLISCIADPHFNEDIEPLRASADKEFRELSAPFCDFILNEKAEYPSDRTIRTAREYGARIRELMEDRRMNSLDDYVLSRLESENK